MYVNRIFKYFCDWIIIKLGDPVSDDMISRQRLYTFIYSSIGMLAGISINLLGVSGPQTLFFIYANSLHLIIVVAMLFLAYYRKLTILRAITIILLTMQTEIAAEMIYSACRGSSYDISLVIGNMVLLSIISLIAVVAYLKYIPLIINVLSIATYGACILITGDEHLRNFFGILTIAYATLSLLSYRLISQVSRLQGENKGVKESQKVLFDLFCMENDQLQAYVILANKKGLTRDEVKAVMMSMGYKARENICRNVSVLMEQEQIDYALIEKRLSMLSPLEREICRLVLEGKKLGEVCTLLDKTENNISFRRSGIRTKLGLGRGDDLRTKLLEIMKGTDKE